MPRLSIEEFCDLTVRSHLLDRQQVRAELARYGAAHPEQAGDAVRFSQYLVTERRLTQWQADKLQDRKYRGFFLGKYKLLSQVGRGGMSTVYLAEHIHMQRRVAIKVLPKNRVGDASYLARFYREAQAAAALDHANIVRAYDIDSQGDTHYLVMEYVQGRELQQIVRQSAEPLDCEQVAYFMAQAAWGLQHAHEAGLIHRDIKPGNLLIDADDHVKLLDMGLARFQDGERASLTVEYDEQVLGTADYLSPEQALNCSDLDARADIYSLGCTMYFSLTGHPPFPDGTLAQRIAKHQTAEPKDLRKVRTDCPASLAAICRRMMAKSPADRYASAGDVAEQLLQWLRDCGSPYARRLERAMDQSGWTATGKSASSTSAAGKPQAARPGSAATTVFGGGSQPTPRESRATAAGASGFPPIVTDGDGLRRNGRRRPRAARRRDSSTIPQQVQQKVINSSQPPTDPVTTGSSTPRPSGLPKVLPSLDDPSSQSLLKQRQQTRSRSQQPPLWLWLALVGLTVTAAVLVYLVWPA